MIDPRPTAGGRATETGMSFQGAVTTWFAAYFLADMPVGTLFGLAQDVRINGLQCETGDALDDVVVRLSNGGSIYVQAKTRPSLTTGRDSPLGRALEQVVELYVRQGRAMQEATSDVALLAVALTAAASLDTLEAACRMFDHGGTWDAVLAEAPEDKRAALELFATHVRGAWAERATEPLTGDDLVAMARLFRIRRFAEAVTDEPWTNAAHLLGRRLFGADDAGEAPMRDLLGISRRLIRSGAPADRAGLLRSLRELGHADVVAPGYQKDVAALLAYSTSEQDRLRKHTRLPLDGGIPIERNCLDPLLRAAEGGSLLVTGEPGAGKTGLLLNLAQRLTVGTRPLIFLSVERFSGFTKTSDFRSELGLEHDLLDVLVNWPGTEPAALVVDALDASRGGPSEAIISAFIAEAVAKAGDRWSIIASIRSFDLSNGRRFREIMPGAPPDTEFVEPGLSNVRHFRVPRLSPGEISAVSEASPRLHSLVATAPPRLQELLENIFNLSLAAELLSAGVEVNAIRSVTTQSELIRSYENARIPSLRLQRAAKAAVTLMVERRRLVVKAVDVENDDVEELLRVGVLVTAGDQLAFAHHVLFDHIASRFYLRGEDPQALRAQISGETAVGLLLGPALRFALEQLWHEDAAGHDATWRFLTEVAAEVEPDPIVVSIALRTAAEQVEKREDVQGLCTLLASLQPVPGVAKMLAQLARFVGMAIQERGGVDTEAASAWANVARAAAEAFDLFLADAARVLLMTLSEKADFSDPTFGAAFGEASRSLLRRAWNLDPTIPSLSAAGIRFVGRSYGSDPDASRDLLQKILEEPRFSAYASDEAPGLADAVPWIIPHAPDFVALIYTTLFTRDVTDEAMTWVGGSASRILPIMSTRRQDYQHARWRLNEALPAFLRVSPGGGTAAVVGAVRGLALEKRRSEPKREPEAVVVEGRTVRVVDDLLSLEDWRTAESRDGKPLNAFVEFLRSCPPGAFRDAVAVTYELDANAAVWARILGVAADRPGIADDLLWPLVSTPRFVALQGLARDAVIYLAAAYPHQSTQNRASFEAAALAHQQFTEDRRARWWRSVLSRFLSIVAPDALATAPMAALRAEMEAGGELAGNRPFMSMSADWTSGEAVVDSMLRGDGVDLERSPDREIRARSRQLEEGLKASSENADLRDLADLWKTTVAVVDALDAGVAGEPHPQVARASWGVVSNSVERIVRSEHYRPDAVGLPDLDVLLGLIDRLLASAYPEAGEGTSDHMAWGNWDVRVYAAASLVALAPRFAGDRPQIVDRMRACLDDPTPTVRLQIAQALNVLWNVAPERMWEMVEHVTTSETNTGILNFFIAGPLWPIAREYPQRCDALLSTLLAREWTSPSTGESGATDRSPDAAANLIGFLVVARDQPQAWGWIERWAGDLRRGEAYLTPMLHSLRQVFFLAYLKTPSDDQLKMSARGRRVLDVILAATSAALNEARPHLLGSPDDTTVAKWQPLFVAADRLIDQVCNQLYFGSGALSSDGDTEPLGLPDADAKQRFIEDYADVLDVISCHAQSRTVHNLIELYGFLLEGDPTAIFDRIALLLLGPAAADGYHFESLGSDGLVKLVRRYIADHRYIFESADRRERLIEVLELFSGAGWPDALKLLFELPDLLR